MDSATTQSLVRRAQGGDREATDTLFAHYAPIVRRGLRRMLGEVYRRVHGDSEDAAQDALLVAFSRLEQYQPQAGASFLAWLLRIAELEALQRLRSGRRQKRGGGQVGHLESRVDPTPPPSPDASPSQVAHGREMEDRVRACLARMPANEREVITLKRYAGMSTAEIRDELQLGSEGAVRALLSRAQVRLAELLDLDGGI